MTAAFKSQTILSVEMKQSMSVLNVFLFFFFFRGEVDKCILYMRCGPLDRLCKFFLFKKVLSNSNKRFL